MLVTLPSFDTFLAASAGVAGALIGLLFVAILVAQERLTGKNANQAHRVRASAALTSFSNALTVALFGLVPGVGLRGPALVVALLGLLFIARHCCPFVASVAPSPCRCETSCSWRVFSWYSASSCSTRSASFQTPATSERRGNAVLVIVCFLIGIARAWELVGGPSIGLSHELMLTTQARKRDHYRPDTTSHEPAENIDDQ